MMLDQLSIWNFKNYEEREESFSPQINCIVGPNGSGKTNMLDAIYYLSMTRSAFSTVESQNIRHGEKFFMLGGTFEKEDHKHQVNCGYQNQKKSFSHNKKEYLKLSEHIGQFPSVLIAPNDTDLVREGSEIRRKFMDSIIAQTDSAYLQELIRYNYALKQRNELLKQYSDIPQHLDQDLLALYDDTLLTSGEIIFQQRKTFVEDHFQSLFLNHYHHLTDDAEQVSLKYKSELEDENFSTIFKKNLQRDFILQRTQKGIHRDDYDFRIEGRALKKFGSQGQQKSFIIAVKLAQFDVIHKLTNIKPLLLLDDIFDKLDDQRILKLIQMISAQHFGQIFLTDARKERTKGFLEKIEADINIIEMEKN